MLGIITAELAAKAVPGEDEIVEQIAIDAGVFRSEAQCVYEVIKSVLATLSAQAEALRAERENSEILLKAGADGAVSMMMELQQDCCALRAENQKLYELLKLWCEVPEVTETAPEDREPETDDVWRKTRAALAQSGGE